MDIFPVWKTTYYEASADTLTFRITNDDGEEIYRARADRMPDEDIIRINLNKPCQNALDSKLSGWNGEEDVVVPQNAYMVFHLQFPDGDGWETVYSFAFTNDWSYEDHNSPAYSEPINGHATPGQILPYSYLVTGDSEEICYTEDFLPIFIITEGNGEGFNTQGGEWEIKYETNLKRVYYVTTWGETGYTSGGTITFNIPSGTTTETFYCNFYEGPGGRFLDAAYAVRLKGLGEYFHLEILTDGEVYWDSWTSAPSKSIQYTKDSGLTWNTVSASNHSRAAISVNSGDTVFFRGTNSGYYGQHYFSSGRTGDNPAAYNAVGNIMSLVYGDDFSDKFETENEREFYRIFQGAPVVSAEDLLLPATVMADYSYSEMFRGCSGLTTAPTMLPSPILSTGCYQGMFRECSSLTTAPRISAAAAVNRCYSEMFLGCISLTAAPQLPATTLGELCYFAMFEGCTALSSAPSLPAPTLAPGCYKRMFAGCSSLRNAPSLNAAAMEYECYEWMFLDCTSLSGYTILPSMELAELCYNGMFEGCTALSKAPSLPATETARKCYQAMFKGCTLLTQAPTHYGETYSELPATALTEYCYASMFEGCSSLTTIPELPATTLALHCYDSMFAHCTSLDGHTNIYATTLAEGCCYKMFEGCTYLQYARTISATTAAVNCYADMYKNCYILASAPQLPATTLASGCYQGMFFGCEALTTAPNLSATTLQSYCYSQMFEGCTRLNSIRCLATDISAQGCTYRWVLSVASSGTMRGSRNTPWTRGENGIPEGWTYLYVD